VDEVAAAEDVAAVEGGAAAAVEVVVDLVDREVAAVAVAAEDSRITVHPNALSKLAFSRTHAKTIWYASLQLRNCHISMLQSTSKTSNK